MKNLLIILLIFLVGCAGATTQVGKFSSPGKDFAQVRKDVFECKAKAYMMYPPGQWDSADLLVKEMYGEKFRIVNCPILAGGFHYKAFMNCMEAIGYEWKEIEKK